MNGMRLIVMRHAKAVQQPGGPDFERALRPRGRRDATAAGQWLARRGFVPDLVLCSAASRALQTWQQVSAELGASPTVRTDTQLYHADADDLVGIIRHTPAKVSTLMYVGHNPAAAQLVTVLTGRDLAFPTCAIAVIEPGQPWGTLGRADGELAASWTPRAADQRADVEPG